MRSTVGYNKALSGLSSDRYLGPKPKDMQLLSSAVSYALNFSFFDVKDSWHELHDLEVKIRISPYASSLLSDIFRLRLGQLADVEANGMHQFICPFFLRVGMKEPHVRCKLDWFFKGHAKYLKDREARGEELTGQERQVAQLTLWKLYDIADLLNWHYEVSGCVLDKIDKYNFEQ